MEGLQQAVGMAEDVGRIKWTPENDERLRSLFESNMTDEQIADEMVVRLEGVRHRRFKLRLLYRRRPHDPDKWSPDRVGLLTKMWMDGLSLSQCAHQLGAGYTRNTIAGKVHRLGLKRPRPVRLSKERRARSPVGARHRRVRLLLVVDNTPDEFIPIEQRRTFAELGPQQCCWPIGDPKTPEFFYCGAPKDYRSYCGKHYQRSCA